MENIFNKITCISDIVDTMIKGLEKEWVKIDMGHYGRVEEGICFGCAATNTLCELMQEPFTKDNIIDDERFRKTGLTISDLDWFEMAIDELRSGELDRFLYYLLLIKHLLSFKITAYEDIYYNEFLPILSTDNYKELLPHYEAYRDFLIQKGL
jgi:hypothetical protein